MNLYLISGLGVDRRLLSRLAFSPDIQVKHLDWIKPLKHETLHSYALRLAGGINQQEEYAIAGVSFGGMIAAEIGLQYHPKAIFLLSSAAGRQELPTWFHLAGALGLNKIVPPGLITWVTPFTYWLFGAHTREEKQLLKDILRDTSPSFVYWALNSILHWPNEQLPPGLLHIHGKEDRVLPVRFVNAEKIIPGAGHLMVYSHAKEVSQIMEDFLHEKEI